MCLCVAYTQDRQFFQVFLHTRARSALNSRVRAGAREHSFCFVFVDGKGKEKTIRILLSLSRLAHTRMQQQI